ncbi:hypothetical protein AX14_006525 [Amanita brunnescens Koide BX004]|nr:hypothetical protein AX14_006525 [Amanita brunnescens Koide BX004]
MVFRRDSRPLTTAILPMLHGAYGGSIRESEMFALGRILATSHQTTLLSVLQQTSSESNSFHSTLSHILATASLTAFPTSLSPTPTRRRRDLLSSRPGFLTS